MNNWYENVPQLGTAVLVIYVGITFVGLLMSIHVGTSFKVGTAIAWPLVKVFNHLVIQMGEGYQ